jgi:hypothetical protein
VSDICKKCRGDMEIRAGSRNHYCECDVVTPESELQKLRESVRRLVGEWEAELEARNCIAWSGEDKASGERLQDCFNQLSAVLAENKEIQP